MSVVEKPTRQKVAKTFCTTREAADILGVAVRTVQLWAESGLLVVWKTQGGHRRIMLDSVHALLAKKEIPVINGEGQQRLLDKRKFRIFVVEDDQIQQEIYKEILPRWLLAPEVIVINDGYEALIRLGLEKPNLLISDLLMPGMDGFKMLNTIKNMPEFSDIKLAVVTALEQSQVKQAGFLPQDIPVFGKPIPFDALENLANSVALQSFAQGR